MEEQTKAEILIRDIKDYLSNQYELAILKATDKLAVTSSSLISLGIAIVLVTFSLLFLSFYVSFYFSEGHNKSQGFLWMGICYLFILIVFLLIISRPLKVFLQNKIILSVMKNIKS